MLYELLVVFNCLLRVLKIFVHLPQIGNFSLVKLCRGIIFAVMTTERNKLTLFINGRKYLAGLIFVVEGDGCNFFHSENFPLYGNFVLLGEPVNFFYNEIARFMVACFYISVPLS